MNKFKQIFINFYKELFHTEKLVPEIEWAEHVHTEYLQNKLRLAIYIIMFTVSLILWSDLYPTQQSEEFKKVYLLLGTCGLTQMVLHYFLFLRAKNKKPQGWRVLIGQFTDNLFLSGAIAFGQSDDSVVAYFTPIYSFLILGNGMRFGLTYLITTMIFAIVGFLWAFWFNPYLISHYRFSWAVILNFAIISLYTFFLIRRLNSVKESLFTAQQTKIDSLQEVGKLKSQFFANISHEFRTPIAVTLASIESVLNESTEATLLDKFKSKLDVVKRNQKRLMSLINQILDLEKLEKGKFALKIREILNPEKFIENRVLQIRQLATTKGIELISELKLNNESEKIYIDTEMIDKCIYNLLSNAIKFTERGSVTIKSYIEGSQWVLSVTDTGIGIKENELERVFERFHQAGGSESKDYAGTGIGLSLVQEITSAHKGTITVDSVYGQGTTFTMKIPTGKSHYSPEFIIDIPYADEDTPVLERHEDVREGKENKAGIQESLDWNENLVKTSFSKERKTLLFVEDNYDLRNFIKESFQNEYNVLLGVDGVHGYQLASEHHVNLIISDQMMPNMSGTDLLKKLKSDNRLAQIPFIILTANASPESKLESLRLGADDFLYKPFHIEEVRVRVRNLMALREQQNRIAEDLKAARAIQQSLLPPARLLKKEYLLEALYMPCEYLSGDFFDIWSSDSKLMFYIADVTSHGVASAQVTYIIKSIFNNIVNSGGLELKANQIMKSFIQAYVENNIDYGVSIQIFTYDSQSREFNVAHSGAPPAFLIQEDKIEIISPESAGYIHRDIVKLDQIGAIDMQNTTLIPGDIIMCYTDGAYEKKDNLEQTSLKRFASRFGKTLKKDDWQIDMQTELKTYHETSNFSDDISILKLQIL